MTPKDEEYVRRIMEASQNNPAFASFLDTFTLARRLEADLRVLEARYSGELSELRRDISRIHDSIERLHGQQDDFLKSLSAVTVPLEDGKGLRITLGNLVAIGTLATMILGGIVWLINFVASGVKGSS